LKIALAIASMIVLAVVGLFVLKQREPIDHASEATSEQKLQAVVLNEATLPAIFQGEAEGPDAAGGFDALLAVADEVGPRVTGGDAEQRTEASAAVCTAMVEAVHHGPFDDGFVDAHIDPGGVFTDPLRQQFHIITVSADAYFWTLLDEGRLDEADALARAQFELGRRVMGQNVRLRGRQRGMRLMQTGLSQVAAAARARHEDGQLDDAQLAETTQAVDDWQQAIEVVDSAWKEKLATISSAKPNVADLVRVADLDEDRTFRVFATHQLGYARYERGERGNQRLIAEAIGRARESDDPLIKAAGIAAGSMTREQFHTSER